MARQCAICGKKRVLVRKRNKLRGKYNPAPKRSALPNLQWVRIPQEAGGDYKKFTDKRVFACTRCIKTLSKKK